MPRYGFITRDGEWMHFNSDKAEFWPKDAQPGDDVICYTEDWRTILCRGGLDATIGESGLQRIELDMLDAMRWFLDRGLELPTQLDMYVLDFDSALPVRKQEPGVMMWPPPDFDDIDDDIPWGGDSPDVEEILARKPPRDPILEPSVETLYYLPTDDMWVRYWPRDPRSKAVGPPINWQFTREQAAEWLSKRGYELPSQLAAPTVPQEPVEPMRRDFSKAERRILDALDGVILKHRELCAKLGVDDSDLYKTLKPLKEMRLVDRLARGGYYRTDSPPPDLRTSPP